MGYKWLSFSVRYLVNVEDLNNVESAGNYIRHRRAPIVFKENGIYTVVYAPVVSGEMIAHGYQMNLVKLALQKGLPVDSLTKQGILLKRGAGDKVKVKQNNNEIEIIVHEGTKCTDLGNEEENEEKGKKKKEKKKVFEEECKYELCVIQEDIVEDVAGFLNPNRQVKRVSNVAFSYMIPALDAIKASTITPQFHTRYTSKDLIEHQSLYNVETASALYVLTGYLNIDGIGKTQNCKECKPIDNKTSPEGKIIDSKQIREKAAIDALMLTLTQFLYGAKQARFKPIVEIEALVVSFSEKPFNLPPINNDFIEYLKQVTFTADAFADFLGINNVLINYYTKDKVKIDEDEIKKDKNKDKLHVTLQGKDNPVEVFKQTNEG